MVRRHIVGQSGTGKSSLLRGFVLSDQYSGKCIIDTAGDLTEAIPHDILFTPTTRRWNPFAEPINPDKAPTFFSNAIKDAYQYDDMTTPLMTMYLTFLAAALINNGRNLTDTSKFLLEPEHRGHYSFVDPVVRAFWETFENKTERDRTNEIASTFNKIIPVLVDTRIRGMFSDNKPKFSLANVQKSTMVIQLPLQDYDRDAVKVVGSLLLTYLAEFVSDDYAFYIEDANLFAPRTLRNILTNGKSGLTISNQYLDQLDDALLAAIAGNCDERYAFRVSHDDAAKLEPTRTSGTPGPYLYDLTNFTYRSLPYDKTVRDGRTVPLET